MRADDVTTQDVITSIIPFVKIIFCIKEWTYMNWGNTYDCDAMQLRRITAANTHMLHVHTVFLLGLRRLDCSNISCPGDFCYYDEQTKEQVCCKTTPIYVLVMKINAPSFCSQICRHCCFANYTHSDDE